MFSENGTCIIVDCVRSIGLGVVCFSGHNEARQSWNKQFQMVITGLAKRC